MCIKLVIKTNLYYDARSEKHQTIFTALKHIILIIPSSLGPKLFLIILLQNIFRLCAFCPYFYAVNVTTVCLVSPL
jgi:hypothetical protein